MKSNISLVSAMLRHFSVLRLFTKLYFRISTFQPNFLCSSSFNKCCWDCENLCKLFFFLRCVWCIWPNVCDVCHSVKIIEIFLVLQYRHTSLHLWKETVRSGWFWQKNWYKFYMKFILLIDTWHIIFLCLNDCSWCELSEYIYGVHIVE